MERGWVRRLEAVADAIKRYPAFRAQACADYPSHASFRAWRRTIQMSLALATMGACPRPRAFRSRSPARLTPLGPSVPPAWSPRC